MKVEVTRKGKEPEIEDLALESWEDAVLFVHQKFKIHADAAIFDYRELVNGIKTVSIRGKDRIIIYQLKTIV
jgi:hypothetical protein